MTNEEQANLLNSMVKVRLAPSKIHGIGVFAITSLPKGTKLYANVFPQPFTLKYSSFNKLFPKVKDLLLERWPQIVNGSHFFYPDTNIQAYLNHSNTPNYDAKNDVMLEETLQGEEIVEDYRRIEGWEKVFPFLKDMV